MSLFDGVMFFCTSTLSDKRKTELTLVLEHNGARPVLLEEATHIITLSLDYEGQDRAKEGSVTVSDSWVDRSLILGRIQLVQHFSPDPTMLFSGVVACVTDLVPSDIEVLSAGITALGGQWRAGLTRDVTHLFAVSPGSEKYQTALRYQKETQVKVLVPHWFDDSVRLGIRGLSTAAYEWPEPTILTLGKPSPETGEVGDSLLRPQNKLSQDKKALYKAALMTAEQEVKLSQAETRDIWGRRRILLSPDLELSGGRRQAIEAGIARSGGVVVDHDAQHADAEYAFDVLIARYRWGPLYVQGVNGRKLIGSLTWLFHVESTGIIGTPTAQLLHYPIPKKPIEGFSAHEITVTNYTGDARDYLKKLIGLMGATFTPSMSGKNTVLIAAYISGNKATKARNWSIPVVNHTWLEDCFIQWRNLSVGLEKYIVFPPGLDFSDHLGERGMQREAILETLPDLVAEMALSQDNRSPVRTGSGHRNGDSLSQMTMKLPSARRAKGTEDTMDEPGTEHPMDIDARPELAGAQEAGGDYMQVDEATVSRGSVQNLQPETGRSSGRTGEGSSPLRQAAHPPQQIYEGPSSTRKRRRRVDRETSSDVPSPTKKVSEHVKSAPTTTGPFVEGPSKFLRQKSTSKSRTTTPLPRLDSVLMPPIGTGEASALQKSPRQSPATKAKTNPMKPKSKGGRVSRMESTPVEHSNAPPLSSFIADTTTDREEGPSTKRTSRRSAANKATQRLREEVMPDVVNFEKEMRRGQVREANFSPKSERERGQEKTKTDLLAKPLGKGRKRLSTQYAAVEEDVSSDGEHDHERAPKKRRRLSSTRSHHDPQNDLGDDGRTDVTRTNFQRVAEIPSSKGGAAKGLKLKRDSQSGTQSENSVRILATQVTLGESEEKALIKLGASVGVRPDECTHLVVKTLARTEKLLCAIAVAPAVVTERWVRDSIAAKKLLSTDKYVLADHVNEKKWKFNLVDALKRAKENKGQLFAGKIFYVTNKVPLDKKLLNNVVSAHGGQLRQHNPTVRALSSKGSSGHHYVISCSEDATIWRPIAEAGHPVYSQELILSAALTQEIRLKAEDVRIDTRR